jgi:hypothetical protein
MFRISAIVTHRDLHLRITDLIPGVCHKRSSLWPLASAGLRLPGLSVGHQLVAQEEPHGCEGMRAGVNGEHGDEGWRGAQLAGSILRDID